MKAKFTKAQLESLLALNRYDVEKKEKELKLQNAEIVSLRARLVEAESALALLVLNEGGEIKLRLSELELKGVGSGRVERYHDHADESIVFILNPRY